jgi:cytochrome c5
LSREPGKEGYSVVCEDCGNESVIFATWEGATMAWNIMQRSARLHKRAVAMRERMKAKGAKPLPDHIVNETIRNLQRP